MVLEKRTYDQFYAERDFGFDQRHQEQFIKEQIIDQFELPKRGKVLEIGCGTGKQAAIFAGFGFEVDAFDISYVAIEKAKLQETTARFYHESADKVVELFQTEWFDLIFVRGMSWYHYELNEPSRTGVDVRQKTNELFKLLKPSGLFVLQIATDFSGSQLAGRVHCNTWQSYISHFEPHGKIIKVQNWKGIELTGQEQAVKEGGNILIATRK
jgi:SAM-dependent methyltransferase